MNTTNKSDNAQSAVRMVKSVAEFVEWVGEIGGQNMLFRGLADAKWEVESSLYRRLTHNGLKTVHHSIFVEMTKILISRVRRNGHDIESGRELNDLELLAKLQHYGAATCLIDFTKNSLVALCFACESANNKDGKVVAFNSDNTDLYKEISINDFNKEIEYWLTEYKQNKKLWILSPKKLNNRIAAQQSVFVFGRPTLSGNFHVCEITNKEAIMEELKKYGISAEMLFDDFVGFSAQNSHNKKYENWDTDSDFVSGLICSESGDFESAIKYYDKHIKSDPENWKAYYNRGNAKVKLGNPQDAIDDYDKAIKLNSQHASAYNNRGLAKHESGDKQGAAADYAMAKKIKSES